MTQLEFDFGDIYEVVCLSEYCTFTVAHGSKEYCEKYIRERSDENLFPVVMRLKEM